MAGVHGDCLSMLFSIRIEKPVEDQVGLCSEK